MVSKVETEFVRKIHDVGELRMFSDGSNAGEHFINKTVALTESEWEDFTNDFTKDRSWLKTPKRGTILVVSKSGNPEDRVVVQNEGFCHAKYVGLVWKD